MLGLGSSITTSTVKTGSATSGQPFSSYSSQVLFERNGDWAESDIHFVTGLVAFSGCSLSIGTTNVGGITNYVIMTKSGGGNGDPYLFVGNTKKSSFATDPQDIYDAGSGKFKITAKAYIPSSNTAEGSNLRVRAGTKANNASATEDAWVTESQAINITDMTVAPDNEVDMFEVQMRDTTGGEPVNGDVMYLTQFKCEFIAD